MADIVIKHLIALDDGKEPEKDHLYPALCKDMTRFEGKPGPNDAVCRGCVEELTALSDEMQKELETYRALFFPTDSSDVPNN